MANTAILNTVSSSASGQTDTQTPQSSVEPTDLAGIQTSAVQPGTATALLNSTAAGIPLGGANLSTVSLGTTTTTRSANPDPQSSHHTNPVLFGFSIALFIIAIIVFVVINRSAKNTTN